MSKIKILVDARCVGGEGQGMLTYLRGMYNALHESHDDKYELYFAGYDKSAIQLTFPFTKDKFFIQLPEVGRIKLFTTIFPKIEKEYGIDFSHYQYVTPFVKNAKHIVTTHDVLFLDFKEEFSFWYRWKRGNLFKRSLKNSEIRLTVSNYSRNRIEHHFGIPTSTLSITPNAVSDKFLQDFSKEQIQDKLFVKFGIENYILYVSRIEKRKNQQLLIETYEKEQLAQKGIQLVLVGNDTLEETNIPETIKKLSIKYPGMVHWFPYVEEEDLINLYQGARLFVYPSLAEGFGIPPIEAAALGIETLCSNTTAMEDFTFFKNNLFDPNDKKAFANKLIELINKTPNNYINRDYREHIESYYNWKYAASVLHRKIQSIAKPNLHRQMNKPHQQAILKFS